MPNHEPQPSAESDRSEAESPSSAPAIDVVVEEKPVAQTTDPTSRLNRKTQASYAALAISVHLALDAALWVTPWSVPDWAQVALLALPISQNGLIALWAATSTRPGYFRFCIALLGAAATWAVMCHVVSDSVSSSVAMAWSGMFLSQSFIVVFLIQMTRLVGPTRKLRRPEAGTGQEIFRSRYTLTYLLLWMAALAIPLTMLRVATTHLGWTPDMFSGREFHSMPVLGIYNGVYTLLVYGSLIAVKSTTYRVPLIGCLLIASTSVTEPYVIAWIFGEPGLDLEIALVLALSQAVIFYATLLPLRRA